MIKGYGLESHRGARVATLSTGTRKKVAIVQALLEPADLLVLDEPTDGLDAHGVQRLRADLEDAVARGATVLTACHTGDLDGLAAATMQVEVRAGDVRLTGTAPPDGRSVAPVSVAAPTSGGRFRITTSGPASGPPTSRVVGAADVDAADVDAALLAALTGGGHVLRVEELGADSGPVEGERP